MKRGAALCAEVSLLSTSIPHKNAAHPSAAINYVGIQEVKRCGKEPVYNMEVDTYHNFSVNGGIIVHNCMDDIRYFCFTILRHKAGKPEYVPLYKRR